MKAAAGRQLGAARREPALLDAAPVQVLARTIAWQAPWLSHLRPYAAALMAGLEAGLTVAEALNALLDDAACRGAGPLSGQSLQRPPVRFVAQSALPAGQAYEDFIFKTGQVPTRENLHDLFNGLCWLQFPQTKTRLNQLQAAQIEAGGVQARRGSVRDALTVFDENAAILLAPEPLWQALQARDWPQLFIALRPLWQDARLVLFGHALLEKLVVPRKPITAHVYCAQSPDAPDAAQGLDRWLAADLQAERVAGKPFVPLPVLGVPHWWAGNEDFSFYDDPAVFRCAVGQRLPLSRPS